MHITLGKREILMAIVWLGLGLLYGLQHYFSYLADGYSCSIPGTILGQSPNFLIWAFLAVYAYRYESHNFRVSGSKFIFSIILIFFLHLIFLFTVNWMVYGGSFQASVLQYLDRYIFGWFYFQALIYSLIVFYYAPSLKERLYKSLRNFGKTNFLQNLEVDCGNNKKTISLTHVESICANDYYIEVKIEERKYLIRKSLKDVELKLDPNRFIRIHRSTIVNIDQVVDIFYKGNQWIVKTQSSAEYPVGRSRKDKVVDLLKRAVA